jgi:ankyrin repeat protein
VLGVFGGGWTPLHLAANNGHLSTVKYLIDDKGANFTLKAHDGWTPLHLAASNGYLDTVKYLIDTKGADFTLKANDSWTPLHSAAAHGKLDVVKYLIDTKKADFTLKAHDGWTPLHLAASNGHLDTVKYLIDTKGVDFTLKDDYGWTLLHKAASFGNPDVVKYLVDTKGADFTLKANDGSTPLHLAASSGKLSVVKYLIEKGADIYVKDEYGRTPLSLIGPRRVELIHYLESKGTHRFRRSEKRSKPQIKGVATPICHGAGRHVTSGAGRVTAWIPQWIMQGIYNLISEKSAIDLPVGHEGAKERIQGNVGQFSTEACMQNNVSVGLLLLQNFFDRNYPLPKFQDITSKEALGYSLNIIEKFEQVISKSCNMPADELIDLAEMQSKIYYAIKSGHGNKVPDILLTYATSAIESRKAEEICKHTESTAKTCLNNVTIKNLFCYGRAI